jgi:hypothetical protein
VKWKTKEAKFKYCGKPVIRRTATAQTPLGEFKVYESVGGKVFMIHPFIKRQEVVAGFDPDPYNTFSTPKIEVRSFEDGIAALEKKWQEVKNIINEYQ